MNTVVTLSLNCRNIIFRSTYQHRDCLVLTSNQDTGRALETLFADCIDQSKTPIPYVCLVAKALHKGLRSREVTGKNVQFRRIAIAQRLNQFEEL